MTYFWVGLIFVLLTVVLIYLLRKQYVKEEKVRNELIRQQEKTAAKQLYPHHEYVKKTVRRRSNCGTPTT